MTGNYSIRQILYLLNLGVEHREQGGCRSGKVGSWCHAPHGAVSTHRTYLSSFSSMLLMRKHYLQIGSRMCLPSLIKTVEKEGWHRGRKFTRLGTLLQLCPPRNSAQFILQNIRRLCKLRSKFTQPSFVLLKALDTNPLKPQRLQLRQSFNDTWKWMNILIQKLFLTQLRKKKQLKFRPFPFQYHKKFLCPVLQNRNILCFILFHFVLSLVGQNLLAHWIVKKNHCRKRLLKCFVIEAQILTSLRIIQPVVSYVGPTGALSICSADKPQTLNFEKTLNYAQNHLFNS